jgi:hypothetical protein
MIDQTRSSRWYRLAALCAALSLAASCGDADKVSAPDDADDDVEVGGTSLGLAEGRAVSVTFNRKVSNPDGTSSSLLPSPIRVPAAALPWAEIRFCSDGTSQDTETCVGHKMMTAAETLVPLYQPTTESSFFGPIAQAPRTSSGIGFIIPVPTASDSATWSLLAADLFASAVRRNQTQLVAPSFYPEFATGQALAIGEAGAGLVEAATKARGFILAAGSAAGAARRQEHWRSVVDSRLTAARTVMAVPPWLFENGGRVPLVAYQGTYGPTFSSWGSDTFTHSKRRNEEAAFWLYSPTLPETRGHAVKTGGVSGLQWTAPNPCTFIPGAPWCQEFHHVPMVDGYSPTACDGPEPCSGGDGLWHLHVTQAAADKTAKVAFSETPEGPLVGADGQPVADRSAYVLTQIRVFRGPGDSSRLWPIARAVALSQQDKTAEDLIRSYRLNPFADGQRIAEDLVLLLQRSYRKLSRNAFLDRLGVTPAALAGAAGRIREEARLLGYGLVPIPGTSNPVQYTVPSARSRRPVDAAYLFAIGEGSNTYLSGMPYAQRGIFHTLEDFLRKYPEIKQRPEVPAEAIAHLDRAARFAAEYAGGGRVSMSAEHEGDHFAKFSVTVDTAPGVTDAELDHTYSVFVGEAGLECARFGDIGGVRCTPAHYRIAGGSWQTVGGRSTYRFSASNFPRQALGLGPSDPMPASIPPRTRIYVLKAGDGAAGLRAITGAELYAVSRGATDFPALTTAMREALLELLAPDPADPANPLMSCAGVETNVRVKLEDELIPVNLDDSIDSSFQYYLDEARKAASFADSLGEQLIEQGLSMDMRAEDAAQELESLCGGTINVGRLQELACDLADCDLGGLLEKTTAELGEFASEVEGARDCFGSRKDSETVFAAVGDQALCAWRFVGAANDRMYQPCQPCPEGAGCPTQCPFIGRPSECEELLKPYAGIVVPVYVTDTLGLSVTELDEKPTPQTLGSWIQTRYGLAVDPTYPTRAAGNTFTGWLGNLALATMNRAESREIWGTWATQANLRSFAQALGYIEKDDDLVITLGNSRWFSVRDVFEHFERDPATAPWPCRGMPGLEEACKWGSGSLLCGACAGSSSNGVATRLRTAIDALKVMTGGGFDNAYVRDDGLRKDLDLRSRGDFAYAGLYQNSYGFEEPFYTASSLDGTTQLRCTEGQWINAVQEGFAAWAGTKVDRPLVAADEMHCSWQSRRSVPDTLPNPVLLWSEGACLQGERGCGAVPAFLAARSDRIAWNVEKKEYCHIVQETGGPRVTERCVSIAGDDVCSALGLPTTCDEWTCSREIRPCRRDPKTGVAQCRGSETCRGWSPSTRRVGGTLSGRDVLDALSIAYRVTSMGAGGCDTLWAQIPTINSVHDFAEVRKAFMCSADSVERQLTRMYLPGVPKDVLDAIRTGAGTFPSHRGEYGEVMANLVSASQNLNRQSDAVVQAIRDIGLSFDFARTKLETLELDLQVQDLDSYINTLNKENSELQLENVELENKIANLRKGQAIANQATSCLVATFNALPTVSCGVTGCSASQSTGAPLAAAATCQNSATQIGLEVAIGNITDEVAGNDAQQVKNDLKALEAVSQKLQLGKQATEQEKRLALLGIQQDVLEKADRVNEASTALNETYASIHALLTRLDTIRSRSRRAASKVLLLDNDDVGRQFNVNTAMRARMNTLRVRYGNARQRAIRAAYMARRAIEQKLGVDLEDISEDVGWLEAPSKWASTLCALPGIDYARIRDAKGQKGGSEAGATTDSANANPFESNGYNYANAYIGDYVTKLEEFIEAYRYEYPFQDGSDTVVVSLRDELIGIREDCDVQGPNLLTNATTCLGSGWEMGCDGEWCLSAQPTDEHPFVCDGLGGTELDLAGDQERTCRAMGGANAVELRYAVPVDGAVMDDADASPSDPPASPSFRYRADNCPLAGNADGALVCNDLSGNGVVLARSWHGHETIQQIDGIGGRPTLRIPAGTLLLPHGRPQGASEYTYAFVIRNFAGGTPSLFFSEINVAEASHLHTLHVNANPDYRFGSYLGEGAEHARADLWATASNAPTLGEAVAVGELVVVRASADSIELLVNGQLRARTHNPGYLVSPVELVSTHWSSQPLEVAEIVAYQRALDANELDALHAYMGARYGTDGSRPAAQFSADALLEARTQGGTSPSSGYQWPDGALRDAATGRLTVTRGGADQAPIVPFGRRRSALRMNGVGEGLAFANVGYGEDRFGINQPTVTTMVERAYTATFVGSCDADYHRGPQNLFGTHWDRPLLLQVRNGTIGYVRSAPDGAHFTTEVVTPCDGRPFLASLRASPASGRLDVFVNGRKVLSQRDAMPLALSPQFGESGGYGFKGALAEGLVHMGEWSDVEVQALHAALGLKYGVKTAGSTAGAGAEVAGPVYGQAFHLTAGDYWVSWHEQTSCVEDASVLGSVSLDGGPSVALVAGGCIESRALSPTVHAADRWIAPGWSRRFGAVNVPASGTLRLAFRPSAGPVPGAEPYLQPSALLAAPQVEKLEQPLSYVPAEFFPTDNDLMAKVGQCEDTDGDTFRGTGRWTYECEYYCPSVLGEGCQDLADKSELPRRCYYELPFMISQADIEDGRLIPHGGFALGNFNYRHDKLAVNVVGTNVKDCASSELPSACYANNFLQFTLHHDEPFRVRNFDGRDFHAPLFPGRIQQGKALMAERYLTNPLSGADRGLLTDYWRTEFRGRPIEGAYTLRVYDTEGFDFSKLEDVQLMMSYRYWTRLQ